MNDSDDVILGIIHQSSTPRLALTGPPANESDELPVEGYEPNRGSVTQFHSIATPRSVDDPLSMLSRLMV